MRISPTTTRSKRSRPAFTLIEVMIVVAIIALMATLVLPKGFFSFEPPLRALQRTVLEVTDIALDGISVRLRMDPLDRADRGRIVVEALSKVEDRIDPAKQTLEWVPIGLRHPLTGEGWRLEPEIIYFYADGTCTPARILRADKDVRITDGDSALLTVTGYLFEEKP